MTAGIRVLTDDRHCSWCNSLPRAMGQVKWLSGDVDGEIGDAPSQGALKGRDRAGSRESLETGDRTARGSTPGHAMTAYALGADLVARTALRPPCLVGSARSLERALSVLWRGVKSLDPYGSTDGSRKRGGDRGLYVGQQEKERSGGRLCEPVLMRVGTSRCSFGAEGGT